MSHKLTAMKRLAAGISLLCAIALPAQAQTVTAVMHNALRVLDPVLTSVWMTRNHGFMIYDTLLGLDAQNQIKPQMAERWDVSEDGKTYRFTLRDGLKWHDGAPVVAADCVASIKRWAQVDKMGQVMMGLVSEMKVEDDRTFSITLTEATPVILTALSKPSTLAAFIMPKRVAETPATQAITEYVGSGPFTFRASDFKPGVKVVYEKNRAYVPRSEPASGTAGGKRVNVDRVEWVTMPDHMTAVNALLNGEVDYLESVLYDLVPMVDGKPNIKVELIDKLGSQFSYRFNHLHPPFNNKLLRQAAMHAIGQEDILKAAVGNPKYYKACAAIFGCGMPYEDSYGSDMVIPANLEKAKALLKEANYDGTPVILLASTDIFFIAQQPLVMASALRKAGFNVELQSMDFQAMAVRRTKQEPPSNGGWSIFNNAGYLIDVSDPLRNQMVAANGSKAWFGWPDVPVIESLRRQFALASKPEDLKRIASEIQRVATEEGVDPVLGQYTTPSAYRTSLSDILPSYIPVFWNLKKAAK